MIGWLGARRIKQVRCIEITLTGNSDQREQGIAASIGQRGLGRQKGRACLVEIRLMTPDESWRIDLFGERRHFVSC